MECTKCKGKGRKWYGSGATWRGGMGVASCTMDICNKCWGSGDEDKPFTDLRKEIDGYRQELRRSRTVSTVI